MIVPRASNGSSVLALPIHRRADYPVKIIPRCLHLILADASGWRHLPSSKWQRPNVAVNDSPEGVDAKLLIFASGMAGMEKISLNEWLLSG